MELRPEQAIIESIDRIYEEAEECKLSQSFFDKVSGDLQMLADYFEVTPNQALFTALIFAMGLKSAVEMNELTSYLSCSPLKIMKQHHDLEELFHRGILISDKSNRNRRSGNVMDHMMVSKEVSRAILSGTPIMQQENDTKTDIIDLLEKLYRLGEQRDENEISTRELFLQTELLVTQHQELPLIRWLHDFGLGIEDTYFYGYLIWKTLSGEETIDVSRATEGIFDNPATQVKYIQKLVSGKSQLITLGLIELKEARFLNESVVKLSERSAGQFDAFGLKLFRNRPSNRQILNADGIPEKQLLFNAEDRLQLTLLQDLLREEKLKAVEARMEHIQMPKGITVIFHGASGTGKTASVMQIARKTGRNIIKVDVSETKSKWYGESEQLIKKVFNDYRKIMDESLLAPILLFNEADGIISGRKDISSSSVAQTENAIQNILLEELETFEGIFIATTNLLQNIDRAFDRRFLFKIAFHRPDPATQSEIWKLKLPHLAEEQCALLASRYDFSGGQIENVARKHEIETIVHGESFNIENIVRYCEAEKFNRQTPLIGFIKN